MPVIAEAIVGNPSHMISAAVGAVALLGGIGKGVASSITRVPPNSAGMWEHHGRPFAKRDSVARRVGKLFHKEWGMAKGDLYGDVEPGTHGHWPWTRSISHIGTQDRFSPLVENPIDNPQRQHNLGGMVSWRVLGKYDDERRLIPYYLPRKDGKGLERVPYKKVIHRGIYKAREYTPGGKPVSAEEALETLVINTCWTAMKEIMKDKPDSHKMDSADAFPLLQERVQDELAGYAVEVFGFKLGDTHLTDKMPEAVSNLLGGTAEELSEGMPIQLGGHRLRLVSDEPGSA